MDATQKMSMNLYEDLRIQTWGRKGYLLTYKMYCSGMILEML
jgi:hypothetical protein